MNELDVLQSIGFVMPSVPYLIGSIIFNIIGYIAYRHGKKVANPASKWIGVVLMLYPILVSDTGLMYLIGCGLCTALYFYRRQ